MENNDDKNKENFVLTFAKIERERMLRHREFRRIVRKHISDEQWKAICEEWANMNNPNSK